MTREVLALLLLGAASLDAADIVLTGATVYTAPDAPPVAAAVVALHDGQIAAAGPRATVRIPPGAQVIDCSGKFIAAGFWNSHVHIFTPGLLHARDGSAATLSSELEAMLMRWGFTTVFDIASVLDNTLALRRRIESGEVRGPRVFTVGEPLFTKPPIYIVDFLASQHLVMPTVKTAEEAVARVRDLAARGADGIKLFTGSYQGGPVDNMTVAMVRAADDEAHSHHLPVFAHPQNTAGLEAAIDGGVDILAHTVPQSPPWTPEFVARLKNAHMALMPTMTLWDFEARKANLKDSDREGWIAAMEAELRAFSQAGGEVLFGTDVGYTDHYDTELEYTLMSRSGMTFPQILASLTTAPARRFGASGHSGRIASGMDADVVVLDGDPAKDITALSKVHLVIRGGTIIYENR
jgi:imidazolonepropionase-like amidohydrolase